MFKRRNFLAASLAMTLGLSVADAADPLKIGMSTAMTGPYSEFGVMQKNATACA